MNNQRYDVCKSHFTPNDIHDVVIMATLLIAVVIPLLAPQLTSYCDPCLHGGIICLHALSHFNYLLLHLTLPSDNNDTYNNLIFSYCAARPGPCLLQSTLLPFVSDWSSWEASCVPPSKGLQRCAGWTRAEVTSRNTCKLVHGQNSKRGKLEWKCILNWNLEPSLSEASFYSSLTSVTRI